MKQISDKQRKKNQIIAKIKNSLIEENGNACRICDGYGFHAAHLMCKAEFPQYYLEPRNIVILCPNCHFLYDNNIKFRQYQTNLISQCREFALEYDVNHYFNL